MKRLVVGFPGLSAGPDGESVLRSRLPGLEAMAEAGSVFRLAGDWDEGSWLGMPPGDRADGPLLIAALGVDPPERSTQFWLTLGSINEEGLAADPGPIDEGLETVTTEFARLATPKLIPVVGRGLDHGLVWEEGSLDLGVTPWKDVMGKQIGSAMPEGDGERMLRRFIEDSVNLLDGLEFNRRRLGEGLPPLNVLWPWGFGFRPTVPHLGLRRGAVATVFARSWTLSGLARLAGYVTDRGRLTQGIHVAELTWGRFLGCSTGVLVSPGSAEMRRIGRIEELAFEVELFDRSVAQPLWERRLEEPFELVVLAPGLSGEHGLGLTISSAGGGSQGLPFDERVFDDPRCGLRRVSELVDRCLTPIE